MDMKRVERGAKGGAMLGVGVLLKMAECGMSVAEVVLNGAENLADHFVKAPKLGIGKGLLGTLKSNTGKLSSKLIKEAKGIFR